MSLPGFLEVVMVELPPSRSKIGSVQLTLPIAFQTRSTELGNSLDAPRSRGACSPKGGAGGGRQRCVSQVYPFGYGNPWPNEGGCQKVLHYPPEPPPCYLPESGQTPLGKVAARGYPQDARRQVKNGFPSSRLSSLFPPERSLGRLLGLKGGGYVSMHFATH